MLWYFIMACLDQVKDPFQILLLPNIFFRKRTPFDESHDEDPVCAIDNFGRDAGSVCRTRGCDLVKSHDTVNRNVFTNPDDKTYQFVG